MRFVRKQKTRRRRQVNLVCYFCKQDIMPDYKDVENLKKFISERGRIINKEDTGVCQKHQRKLSSAIKRARFVALLPYIVRPV